MAGQRGKDGKYLASTLMVHTPEGTCIRCKQPFENGVALSLPDDLPDDPVCMPCFSRAASKYFFGGLADQLDFS